MEKVASELCKHSSGRRFAVYFDVVICELVGNLEFQPKTSDTT